MSGGSQPKAYVVRATGQLGGTAKPSPAKFIERHGPGCAPTARCSRTRSRTDGASEPMTRAASGPDAMSSMPSVGAEYAVPLIWPWSTSL